MKKTNLTRRKLVTGSVIGLLSASLISLPKSAQAKIVYVADPGKIGEQVSKKLSEVISFLMQALFYKVTENQQENTDKAVTAVGKVTDAWIESERQKHNVDVARATEPTPNTCGKAEFGRQTVVINQTSKKVDSYRSKERARTFTETSGTERVIRQSRIVKSAREHAKVTGCWGFLGASSVTSHQVAEPEMKKLDAQAWEASILGNRYTVAPPVPAGLLQKQRPDATYYESRRLSYVSRTELLATPISQQVSDVLADQEATKTSQSLLLTSADETWHATIDAYSDAAPPLKEASKIMAIQTERMMSVLLSKEKQKASLATITLIHRDKQASNNQFDSLYTGTTKE